MKGSIPTFLGSLNALTEIRLDNNNFVGDLPKELIKLTKLKELHVHFNKLEGKVPKEIDRKKPEELDFVYGNNIGLKADYRENLLDEDMNNIKSCWKKMIGGKSEDKKEKSLKTLYHEGGDKDLRKWKGVKVNENNRVAEIGKRQNCYTFIKSWLTYCSL